MSATLRQQVRDQLVEVLRGELARDNDDIFGDVWGLCVRGDDIGAVEGEIARIIRVIDNLDGDEDE